MGYRVEYDISGKRTVVDVEKKRRGKWFGRIFFVVATVALLIYGIAENWFWEILFPGYNESTKVAAEHMIHQIREGESVGDAVTAFCKEIVTNAR